MKNTKGLWLVALPVLYLVNYLVTPVIIGRASLELYCRPSGKAAFKSQDWKRDTNNSGIRYLMANDLMKKVKLKDLKENEVVDLLGPPTVFGQLEDGKQLIYVLGPQRMYPSKSIFFPYLFGNNELWTLQIWLHNGQVTNVQIRFS